MCIKTFIILLVLTSLASRNILMSSTYNSEKLSLNDKVTTIMIGDSHAQ